MSLCVFSSCHDNYFLGFSVCNWHLDVFSSKVLCNKSCIVFYLIASLQIGVVSDDELLNLLDLALSSDTANTVRRARELMVSRVDPLQLVSQLANVIMDILAGRSGFSELGRSFIQRHAGTLHMPFAILLYSSNHHN